MAQYELTFTHVLDLERGEAEKLILNLMFPDDEFRYGTGFAVSPEIPARRLRRVYLTQESYDRYVGWRSE